MTNERDKDRSFAEMSDLIPVPNLSKLESQKVALWLRTVLSLPFDPKLSGEIHGRRWIGLDKDHVYFVAQDQIESQRLRLEAKILHRLKSLGCHVPEILIEKNHVQMRTRIQGGNFVDGEKLVFGKGELPNVRYSPGLKITSQGKVLARELGITLAKFHGAFPPIELNSLAETGLREFRFNCFQLQTELAPHLSFDQQSSLNQVIERYAGLTGEPVFCHGDLNHHNFCSDPKTGHLIGVFDFGDSCLGYRELDFKFILSNGWQFQELCLEAYQSESGIILDIRSILDHHILAAADNLIYALHQPRHGIERCQQWLSSALNSLTSS